MQIIIVEAEIKQAIKDLILNQMSIKEGMDVEIDLKATRGEAGFMATIDIVPAKAAAPVKAEAPAAPIAKPVTKTVEVKKETPAPKAVELPTFTPEAEVPVSQGKAETPAEEPPVEGMIETSDSTSTETAGPGSEAAAEPSSTEPQAEQDQSAEAKPAGRSLFGNLKRVSNS
jgi:outer membrane biosynthesis protein TonB